MKLKLFHFFGWIIYLCWVGALFSDPVNAESCEQWAAKAVSVQGQVETLRVGEEQWRPLER